MAYWSWQTCTNTGVPLDELALTQRSISFFLNRPATASGSLDITGRTELLDLLQPGVNELRVFRDGDEMPTSFRLSNISISRQGDSVIASLQWDGIMSYLADLLIYAGTSISSTAQSSLAWTLIDTAQSRSGGDYGITRGEIPGTDPTKSYKAAEDTELLAALVQLSERSDGFDFDVDASRRFNVYYPQRGSSIGVRFDTAVNVLGYQLDVDGGAGAVVTDARIRGGPGSSVQSASDTDARSVYRRREASIQYSGVIDDNTVLAQYASRVVADRSSPLRIPRITLDADHTSIPWGSYGVGDTCTVKIAEDTATLVEGAYRIVAVDVVLDESDNEDVSVELNEDE